MAFEFGDQPDYYSTAHMPRYWDVCHEDMEVASGDGYGGANAWTASSEGAYAVKFPADVDQRSFGQVIRCQIDSLPSGPVTLLGVVDAPGLGSPETPLVQCSAVLNPDGTMSIYRGDASGTVLATSITEVPTGSHVRIAFSGTVDPVSGTATVWLGETDGTPLVAIAQVGGGNTDATGSGQRRGVYMGGAPDIFTSYLYCQGAGTLPANPLCDIVQPNQDSGLQDWTTYPTSSPVDMAAVTDEAPANDDSDYGVAPAVDAQYALEMDPISTSRLQILGVRLVVLVERIVPPEPDAPLAGTFTPLMRSKGGGVSLGDVRTISDSEWIGVDQSWAVNPFTGDPFTPATINASAWGGVASV